MRKIYLKLSCFLAINSALLLSCNEKTDQEGSIPEISVKTDYETDVRLALAGSNELSASMNMGIVSFTYSATTGDGKTSSKLLLYKGGEKAESDFVLDENLRGYKFDLHHKVIEQAKKLLAMFTPDEIRYVTGQYEIFGRKILASKDVQTTSPLVQSIYFHNAVLNVVNRSLQNGEECNCTPDPAYYVGKGKFFCTEDLKINTGPVLAVLQNMKIENGSDMGKIAAYIRAHSDEEKISIDRIYELFVTKENFRAVVERYNTRYNAINAKMTLAESGGQNVVAIEEPDDCDGGMSGSDIGCCGNYEGCCLFWAAGCIAHDMLCWCCDHWYCGNPICQPESGC